MAEPGAEKPRRKKAAAKKKSAPRKKSAASKAAAKKTAAAKTPARAPHTGAADPAGKERRRPLPGTMPPEARWRMIAEAAYLRAEKRGWVGGDPVEDWLHAEHEVDALLGAPPA